MELLKEFFKKVDKKYQQMTKKHVKHRGQRVNDQIRFYILHQLSIDMSRLILTQNDGKSNGIVKYMTLRLEVIQSETKSEYTMSEIP